MYGCRHYFELKDGNNLFICKNCGFVHECSRNCEYLTFNKDNTKVCSMTGLCYEQKMCDVNSSTNDVESEYHPKIKKNQQIKNSFLNSQKVIDILQNDIFPECDMKTMYKLETQIQRLWVEYIECCREKQCYIHRKDNISFVVGILFSLKNGMKSTTKDDYIIFPHSKFQHGELNKKKKYRNFEVSNITYGIRKIKQAFENYDVKNKICVEEFF